MPLAFVDGPKRAGSNSLYRGHLPRVHLPVVTGVSVTSPVLKTPRNVNTKMLIVQANTCTTIRIIQGSYQAH